MKRPLLFQYRGQLTLMWKRYNTRVAGIDVRAKIDATAIRLSGCIVAVSVAAGAVRRCVAA